MAWPFSGNSGGNKSADQNLSEERLKILANVAIEQVPFPEQGMLTEEDAWTISPGPTRARINSQQSVPNVAATLAPAPTPVPSAPATVDTSGLERLISSRLDMVEDVLRMVEHRLEEGVPAQAETGADAEDHDDESLDEDVVTGDRIITASGEVVEVGGTSRMMEDDQGQLVELYEAQALAANPFLVAPRSSGSGNQTSTGAPTVAALLLDHMSGMAAVSFTQKAMESGMLTQEEGDAVLAIVQLAEPGDPETALEDHLPHRELLVFSALVSSWRQLHMLRGEE
ncbi:MAG: hypothetical protein VXZ04_00090 [Candidatus Thermoplasmatota archaeon]|nr:hypothetical protein [Candidatus Thermoplasmatota archaeon]MEC7350550.1 hypothetical protein [Candidatus Thermoplasmatota archaeon]MEC7444000.1 hypothetical protein [Candidatus Thermoplasmatota archaeon]MEC7504226.1 hypothetical protein [Candidatus Thermoplasmatota archaeon]MEC7507650.1 hypothetical protein [Candidatus Thermoplasmatota archaeon]